jgi:hypothetical protein
MKTIAAIGFTVVLFVLAMALGITLAFTAHADPSQDDADYLHLLARDGVPVPYPAVAIQNAHQVCAMMANPLVKPVDVADALSAQAGLPWDMADSVVNAAIIVYCDQLYRPSI